MIQRLHAREIDPDAVRAVLRASEKGRREGRDLALREAARRARVRDKRARSILWVSVVTALLAGFSVGAWLGATSPRALKVLESSASK